jgi:hypothetical protein
MEYDLNHVRCRHIRVLCTLQNIDSLLHSILDIKIDLEVQLLPCINRVSPNLDGTGRQIHIFPLTEINPYPSIEYQSPKNGDGK